VAAGGAHLVDEFGRTLRVQVTAQELPDLRGLLVLRQAAPVGEITPSDFGCLHQMTRWLKRFR
jgi:hypothetical protein